MTLQRLWRFVRWSIVRWRRRPLAVLLGSAGCDRQFQTHRPTTARRRMPQVRLAVLGRDGANGGPDVVKSYLDRALPEIKDAATELETLVKFLPTK
jgi:hypothetical protein